MLNGKTPDAGRTPTAPKPTPLPDDARRALLRLHQLACEIRGAIARKDIRLVCRAASLLAPALAHWNVVSADLPVSAGEAVQIAMDTRQMLMECEGTLMKAMGEMSKEMRRLRQGRRAIVVLRAGRTALQSRRIDTGR